MGLRGGLSLKTKLGLGFSFVALSAATILTIALYLNIRINVRQELREELRHFVDVSALLIDADQHSSLESVADEGSPPFLQIQTVLKRIRERGYGIRYVYTVRQRVDGRVVFVVDADSVPGDFSQPHLGDVYEEPGPTLMAKIATLDEPIVEQDFYSDKWGRWLTGYAPIITSAGVRDGVLCIDIAATEVVAREQQFFWIVLAVNAVIAPIAIALGWLVGHRVTYPIGLLKAGVERIAGGDLKSRVTVDGGGEIAELAGSFNSMAGRLGQSLEELQTEIEIRKRAEEEVRQLNRELETRVIERTRELAIANQELEAFTHSVSHDLRAPLRAIEGFSEALEEDCGDKLDEEGKTYLGHLRQGSREMNALIDGLLKLSRSTGVDMARERVDLSLLAATVAENLRQREPERQVSVRIAKGVAADVDPRLLKVVMENLLGNALKYTSKTAEACIEFGVEQLEGETIYFVRDNGAGFDMSYVDKLFMPFQRLHREGDFPGTGIGLATVQRIIHRHGGRIWAEGAVGEGATFYFTLEERGADQARSDHPTG